jgi:adenosylcobinamide-GDP ribazoletransferase
VRRALSFLTVLGRAGAPTSRTLSWFPLVGLVVGALVGVSWWASARVWPALLAAIVAVAVDAGTTGGLHLDGLADAADGLLPAVDRERRLEIMADPSVGAFGVVTLVVVLLLRVGALASVPATGARVLVVVGLWTGSRTLMAVTARALPYAHHEGGLAAAFRASSSTPDGASLAIAGYGLALACAVAAWGGGTRGVLAVVAEVLAAGAVAGFAYRRLGGYSGDVLGAAGVMGETIGLLVLAAR